MNSTVKFRFYGSPQPIQSNLKFSAAGGAGAALLLLSRCELVGAFAGWVAASLPEALPAALAAITPALQSAHRLPAEAAVGAAVQLSWRPPQWQRDSPWMRLFRNARVWVG